MNNLCCDVSEFFFILALASLFNIIFSLFVIKVIILLTLEGTYESTKEITLSATKWLRNNVWSLNKGRFQTHRLCFLAKLFCSFSYKFIQYFQINNQSVEAKANFRIIYVTQNNIHFYLVSIKATHWFLNIFLYLQDLLNSEYTLI